MIKLHAANRAGWRNCRFMKRFLERAPKIRVRVLSSLRSIRVSLGTTKHGARRELQQDCVCMLPLQGPTAAVLRTEFRPICGLADSIWEPKV